MGRIGKLHAGRTLAFCCALIGASSVAVAAPIIVDFDEIPTGSYFDNITSNGIRISPYCHVDIVAGQSASSGNAMGWDNSDCSPNLNADYLGQPPSGLGTGSVFIDFFDHPFTFTSFFFETVLSSVVGYSSSKGGSLKQKLGGRPICLTVWPGMDDRGSGSMRLKWQSAPYVDSLTFNVARAGT
jgi:hypothetical protein